MFLKRIDVTGFKSFADKTEIDFSPGITAVVGPNGSGKSNIADAIRWVLGEQSARSLRGAKMEDVIFAGSETRRAINFCEVSLTLDNGDHHLPVVFDEVTVTRRVYRSGDSEYLINKQVCRLKDIAELFMDSGMGRESYSIVGQGKIEEMLSTRPEDRRSAFEDAAGIVKFKFRKKEAERRLEETEQNILRAEDILDELQKQAGPLQIEAERAAKYKVLQDEYRQLDIGLLVVEIENLTEKWKTAQRDLEESAARRDAMRQESAAAELKSANLRGELEERRRVVDSLQTEYVRVVELRQQLQGQLEVFKERIANAEQALSDREEQRHHTSEEHAEVCTRIAEEAEALQTLVSRLESTASELEVASSAVDPAVKQQIEDRIARLNEEYIELHQKSANYRNELRTAEEYFSTDKQRAQRIAQERERLIAERDGYHASVEEAQSRLRELSDHQKSLAQELNEMAVLQRQDAEQEAALVARVHQLQSELASQKSRLELLSELESGYDGYALGAKTVLQAADKGRLRGVHGAVASLIQVDKRHEVAVETALGAALQNIAVDDETAARAAINLLKERHAGRATFLPLSVIKSRALRQDERDKIAGRPGVVGVASDVVRTLKQHQPILDHLLGNVIITETLQDANAVASLLQYRYRIVSLEGDVVSPGGAMTGGSVSRKGPGLLGRSRERADVESSIASKVEQLKMMQSEQQSLRARLETAAARQRDVISTVEANRTEEAGLQSSLREAQTRAEAVSDRLQNAEWEMTEMSEGRVAWESRVETANQALADIADEIQKVEQTIQSERNALALRERTLSETQARLTALRVDAATIQQEQQSRQLQLDDLQGRKKRLELRLEQIDSESVGLRETMNTTIESQQQADLRLAEVIDSIRSLEEDTSALRMQLQVAEAAVTEAEQLVRRKQQDVASIEELVHRAQIQVERTDVELNHALDRMGEAHRMTFEWARAHHALTVDVDAAKRRADSLRREIASMGEVHIGAIEEWERLSERLTFLQREHDDLRMAKEQLESVITEIDDEMSKRFLETFEQIRAEFQVSFRQLFGGGKADLALTNPDDLLGTGIEVIAQPPGKKLQNLNLLSGGERAIIAMALLFAILKVRPVPFCVLDEVEAALDEANVHRFATQLRTFAGDTQFIVITHRRGTMEEADALYGVTMQESGVSSLLGVRLEDAEVDFETA